MTINDHYDDDGLKIRNEHEFILKKKKSRVSMRFIFFFNSCFCWFVYCCCCKKMIECDRLILLLKDFCLNKVRSTWVYEKVREVRFYFCDRIVSIRWVLKVHI